MATPKMNSTTFLLLMVLSPGYLVPDSFVVVEKDQLHNEADQCEDGTAADVAEHLVGNAKAYEIAESLPGDSLCKGSPRTAGVRLHRFPFGRRREFTFAGSQCSPIQSKKYQRLSRSITGSCAMCWRYLFTSSHVEKIISKGSVPKSQSGVCSMPCSTRTRIGFLQRLAQYSSSYVPVA